MGTRQKQCSCKCFQKSSIFISHSSRRKGFSGAKVGESFPVLIDQNQREEMMMKRLLAAAVLTLVCTFNPMASQAADGEGKYAVRGAGSTPCRQLAAAIDSKDANVRRDAVLLYASWLNGYLSYVNRVEKETYDIVPLTDSAHLLAVVVGQCRQNPDALVETVSAQVIAVLAKAKIAAESPLVELKVGDQKGNFRQATLMALQEKLIEKRYLKGKADGFFGGQSQQALRAFQKAKKLRESGFPDTETLMRALLK